MSKYIVIEEETADSSAGIMLPATRSPLNSLKDAERFLSYLNKAKEELEEYGKYWPEDHLYKIYKLTRVEE